MDDAREECLLGLNHAPTLYTDLTASPNETLHAHLLRGSVVLRFDVRPSLCAVSKLKSTMHERGRTEETCGHRQSVY